jgi:hypothetical protein
MSLVFFARLGIPDDNSNHPSPVILGSILRTDQVSWIELTTDGKQMWVEVERQSIIFGSQVNGTEQLAAYW